MWVFNLIIIGLIFVLLFFLFLPISAAKAFKRWRRGDPPRTIALAVFVLPGNVTISILKIFVKV